MVIRHNRLLGVLAVIGVLVNFPGCKKQTINQPSEQEIMNATRHLDGSYNFEYRQGYFQGMQEAYTEIRNNKITKYIYGKVNLEDIDKDTVLPLKVIAGCIVSDLIVGRADGHYYIIHKFLKGEIR